MPADSSNSNPEFVRTTPALAGVSLSSPFFLAPVAGYSDAAFRSVCHELGAGLCYTEMVSSEALTRDHPKTKKLLERAESETRYAIQLFGSKPEVLARAAVIAAGFNPLVIDLNCGCPVPKIVKTGAGSALLRSPESIRAIVAAMREAVGVPITVKIRKGWDDSSINYRETALAAVEAGAAAVTLHGRTRAQGYSGMADWASIADLVLMLAGKNIPVFGSGDVFSAADAVRMIGETGVAGVMIARGAMGNPFIFEEARALYEGVPVPRRTDADVASIARRHLEQSIGFLGERTACVEFRKHVCAYTRGRARGAALRERAVHCATFSEFEAVLRDFASPAG